MGKTVKQCVNQFPSLSFVANIQPVTRSVLRVRLTITAEFDWNDKVHGGTSEPWWIWIEDPDNDHIYHSEYFLLLKKHVSRFADLNCLGVEICVTSAKPSWRWI